MRQDPIATPIVGYWLLWLWLWSWLVVVLVLVVVVVLHTFLLSARAEPVN